MSAARIAFVPFVETVLGLDISPAWVVLLRVAVDGVDPVALPEDERAMARILFGEVDTIPAEARRILCWRLGRASGKTTLAAALGVWLMMTSPLGSIGPGMTPAVVTVAPGKPTAKLAVGVARELVRRVPSLERLVCDDGDTSAGFSLTRPDGRRVSFVSVAASRGGTTLRGYDLLALIVDEAEFLASGEDFAVNDRDLFAAARPRLHGPAIFISTPWPVENLTAELFQKNHGNPTTALAALGGSTTMRPEDARLARDVAQALIDDEENAAREYLCQPGARGGSRLFDPDTITAAIVEGRPLVIMAAAGAAVGIGGDLGLERDSSVVAAVANVDGAFDLLEFDEVRPSKDHPLAPGFVVRERFAPVMQRHGATEITCDAHYRQSAIEHLDALGLSFVDAPGGQGGKYDSFMFLRALLRTGKLKIPAVPRLIAQLRAVTLVHQTGGGTKITSPRRMGQGHGDIVSALVLGCWAAREGGGALPVWARPGFSTGARTFFGGFDPFGDVLRPGEKPPDRIRLSNSVTGQVTACGLEPHFAVTERATWSRHEPSPQFTAAASPAFREAVTVYREKHAP